MSRFVESVDVPHKTCRALHANGLPLLIPSFQTLGIIYSDLGTSPLYVLNGIWPATGAVPSEENIIGGISAIIWAITLLPLVKYVLIYLRFGTYEGEGGTFALFQSLFPPEDKDYDADRCLTWENHAPEKATKWRVSYKLRWPLLVWSLFGTCLTLADGVFTPVVSVTTDSGGIAVAKPNVQQNVIPISVAFLVTLFLVQSNGTKFLAYMFSPVTFIWLSLLAATGIVNIIGFPGILRAFDSSRTVLLFMRTKDYDLLAGILLALTGSEALFAKYIVEGFCLSESTLIRLSSLGQFKCYRFRLANTLDLKFSYRIDSTHPAILWMLRLSMSSVALHGTRRLIVEREAVFDNIFYRTIPGSQNGPLFWILYVFAILATLTASQAMVTATFSLVQQLVNMRTIPPLCLKYTSDTIQGQVYIPLVNWILLIVTVIVIAAFHNPVSLTNAYGFAVSTVFIVTTVLISIQIVYVKHKPAILAFAFLIAVGFIDALFWGAALKIVPEGAWVPLMMGLVLLMIMILWTWAKGLENQFDGRNRRHLREVITQPDKEIIDDRSHTKQLHSSIPGENVDEQVDLDSPMRGERSSIVGGQGDNSISAPGEPPYSVTPHVPACSTVPTCDIFHKLTPGRGVPHSFTGFIRQWPALPRVVIFISSNILPIPRVPVEDRYVVSKVKTVQGFYGVTYNRGFQEQFNVEVEDIIEHICSVESYIHTTKSSAIIRDIKEAARTSTHIVPYYVVHSKTVEMGRFAKVVNAVRRFLIEEIYRNIAIMFPEFTNWAGPGDQMIHVGINALI